MTAAPNLSKAIPFDLHTSSATWLPTTPRDKPYIEHFQPTQPLNKWMTALRVETSKQNAIDFYSKPAVNEEEMRRKKYLRRTGPSEA